MSISILRPEVHTLRSGIKSDIALSLVKAGSYHKAFQIFRESLIPAPGKQFDFIPMFSSFMTKCIKTCNDRILDNIYILIIVHVNELYEPCHEKTCVLHMQQELSHDSIARLNCALLITITISVIW